MDLTDCRAANANLGTNKIGVWGLRPQRGPGAAPLAFCSNAIHFAYSDVCTANFALYAARNSVDFFSYFVVISDEKTIYLYRVKHLKKI